MEKRRQRTGGTPGRTYAGDADPVGFHHRMGPWFRPEEFLAAPPARQFRRSAGSEYSSLPAAFSRRVGIPSICRPSCNSRKPPHRTKPRKCRGIIFENGLDGIKLFTGVYMGDKPVVNMDVAIARAAVEVAHAQGKPVFAHPQNRTGLETVIEAGVDVMAHITPGEPGYSRRAACAIQIAGDRIDSDAFPVCENDRRGRVVCPAGRFRRQSAQGIFRKRQPRAVWDRRRLHHDL